MELETFGWNLRTARFLSTLIFAIWGAIGLVGQIRNIWSNQSGKAVSNTWIISFTFMFGAFFVYGLDRCSIAMIVSGICRTPLYIPILIGLWRFEGFERCDKLFFSILVVGLIYMIFSPHKNFMFLVFSYVGIAATVFQPWEVWKSKSSGVISVKLLVIYTASVASWAIYGFLFGDWWIMAMGLSYVVLYSTTIGLCVYYRNKR